VSGSSPSTAASTTQLVRSRVLALYLGLMLLLYARDVGFAALERECLAGLERTLVDWP
jgi:hypothetical protein